MRRWRRERAHGADHGEDGGEGVVFGEGRVEGHVQDRAAVDEGVDGLVIVGGYFYPASGRVLVSLWEGELFDVRERGMGGERACVCACGTELKYLFLCSG